MKLKLLAVLVAATAVLGVSASTSAAEICPSAPSMSEGASVSASCYWPQVTVQVSPASISDGQSATVSFAVSGQDPSIDCQKGGAWSGTIDVDGGGNASGSAVVSPPGINTYTYSVTCPANPQAGYDEAVLSVGGQPVNSTACRFTEQATLQPSNTVYALLAGQCVSSSPLIIKATQCVQRSSDFGHSWLNKKCSSVTEWDNGISFVTSYACQYTTYPYNKFRGQSVVRVQEIFTGLWSSTVVTSHGLNAIACD